MVWCQILFSWYDIHLHMVLQSTESVHLVFFWHSVMSNTSVTCRSGQPGSPSAKHAFLRAAAIGRVARNVFVIYIKAILPFQDWRGLNRSCHYLVVFCHLQLFPLLFHLEMLLGLVAVRLCVCALCRTAAPANCILYSGQFCIYLAWFIFAISTEFWFIIP